MKKLVVGILSATALTACANETKIVADTTSSSSSSAMTMGGTGGGSSGKSVTADVDIAQYASISVSPMPQQKVVEGPFFVTDVFVAGNGMGDFYTVTGSDCAAPEHARVLQVASSMTPGQAHGIRLPILTGQSFCSAFASGPATVLGFRPY